MQHKQKILIVDDLPQNLVTLEQLLEDIEVDLYKASNGNEAVMKAFEYDFDLILMDIQMPGMNGFEAVKLIKREEKNSFIPIIFLTAAYSDKITEVEGVKAGAVDFLTKPISEELLIGKVQLFLDMQKDKTELKETKQKLEKLLFYDPLTSVLNRKPFMDLLEKNIIIAQREKKRRALLFLDLEKFKQINDLYGHKTGDEILVYAAEKIKSSIREGDLLGRFGGNEFVLYINTVNTLDDAVQVAQRINKSFLEIIELGDLILDLGVSIGISIYPDDGTSALELLKSSDLAMYKSKKQSKNSFQVFNKILINELSFNQALEHALENNQFKINYQVIVDRCMNPTFFEAFIRWEHPELGNIPPMDFIPILEKDNSIVEVGEWVFREVCIMLKKLNNIGKHIYASINVSQHQIANDNFTQKITDILKETNISPSNIQLEITEKFHMDNVDKVKNVINELKKTGIGFIALDDFGTGYSSFSNLAIFKLDIVKIDNFFVERVHIDKYKKITQTLINLIKNFDLKIIAKGIETQEQFECLAKMGCDYF